MAATPGTADLARNLWERLETLGRPVTFRRHSFIYTPTQPAHALYLLRGGQVSLQLLSTNGKILTLKVIEAGQLFGHSALMPNATYDTSAEALKTVSATVVPRQAVLSLLEAQPGLSMALIESFGQHNAMVSRRLEEVAFKSVPARLASLLLDMAGSSAGAAPSHVPHRTHQQLAEMVNAYRETVTKIINQFRAARLLDIDRSGITLLNPTRLRELAQS
ncbi:MAG: Crp/Fnr family transcriptional regulator [Chloroflexaceae bacterium]|jgi:CRP-like cAMP-binding protein|nr:Crp/Fnr family transcriptional regulator [Chloroflexaceae bacterium]